MGPSRSQEREEECSLSAGQECITMRIAQMIVFLIAGKTIFVKLTTVSTALCTNCRTDRNHKRTRGKRMFGIDLRGEVLALAQVGVQSHDDILSARDTFHHIVKRAVHVEGSL